MKSYNHIIEKIISDDNLAKAIRRSSRGKKKRGDVRWCLANQETVIKKVREMILNETFEPPKHKPKEINDGIKLKKRIIVQPHYLYEQIIHHAIVQIIAPHIEQSSYLYSCGSMPKRGGTHGKKCLEKFIRNNPKHSKYVLKMDIHHFFASIDHDVLMNMIRNRYHDEKFCRLMEKIIRSGGKGLPIGYYTSQWLANWYLEGLDYFIKQECGAKCYVRYMDDMIVLGNNKKKLHETRRKVSEYLKSINLLLNGKWQVFRLKSRDIDFMGFRFFTDRVTLRKTILLRATRKANRTKHLTWYNACQMLSYLGWFKHADCYSVYLTWIKPHVSARKLKKRISVYQRRLNHEACMA